MLKAYWKSMGDIRKDAEIELRRSEKLFDEVMSKFPADVDGEYSSDNMGTTLIRMFIYLPKEAPEEFTKKARSFITQLCGKAERLFREDSGTFTWKGMRPANDEDGTYEEMILIENAHKGLCEIKQVTKAVTCYESVCPEEAT